MYFRYAMWCFDLADIFSVIDLSAMCLLLLACRGGPWSWGSFLSHQPSPPAPGPAGCLAHARYAAHVYGGREWLDKHQTLFHSCLCFFSVIKSPPCTLLIVWRPHVWVSALKTYPVLSGLVLASRLPGPPRGPPHQQPVQAAAPRFLRFTPPAPALPLPNAHQLPLLPHTTCLWIPAQPAPPASLHAPCGLALLGVASGLARGVLILQFKGLRAPGQTNSTCWMSFHQLPHLPRPLPWLKPHCSSRTMAITSSPAWLPVAALSRLLIGWLS